MKKKFVLKCFLDDSKCFKPMLCFIFALISRLFIGLVRYFTELSELYQRKEKFKKCKKIQLKIQEINCTAKSFFLFHNSLFSLKYWTKPIKSLEMRAKKKIIMVNENHVHQISLGYITVIDIMSLRKVFISKPCSSKGVLFGPL